MIVTNTKPSVGEQSCLPKTKSERRSRKQSSRLSPKGACHRGECRGAVTLIPGLPRILSAHDRTGGSTPCYSKSPPCVTTSHPSGGERFGNGIRWEAQCCDDPMTCLLVNG